MEFVSSTAGSREFHRWNSTLRPQIITNKSTANRIYIEKSTALYIVDIAKVIVPCSRFS